MVHQLGGRRPRCRLGDREQRGRILYRWDLAPTPWPRRFASTARDPRRTPPPSSAPTALSTPSTTPPSTPSDASGDIALDHLNCRFGQAGAVGGSATPRAARSRSAVLSGVAGRPEGGTIGWGCEVGGGRSPVPLDRASTADLMLLATDVGPAPMHVGAVLVLGTGPGFSVQEAQRLLGERVREVPRLRQRLRRAPPGCGRPFWADDPVFDLRHHVRQLPCPPPGDERALLDVAAAVTGEPLLRSRPLWSATFVTGLAVRGHRAGHRHEPCAGGRHRRARGPGQASGWDCGLAAW